MIHGRSVSVISGIILVALGALWQGCSENGTEELTSDTLPLVRLQANWYAQTSHGGFHQAMAKGIYEKHGVQVELMDAGPGSKFMQKVALGDADIGMNRFDSIAQAVDKGLPIVAVAIFMYHDAAAFMVREDSPVKTFSDLDGRRVMLAVGSTFEAYFRRQFDIEFKAVPYNWGYGEFMIDPELTQQSYVTNEPYFVAREGVATRTLPFYEAGYDPPQVLFANREFLEKNPDTVRRFLAATIEGYLDFMDNDPQPAFDSIHSYNPNLDQDHMRFAHGVLVDQHFLRGEPELDYQYGTMPDAKMRKVVDILKDLDLVSKELTLEECVDSSFLPGED
ncbi:ABC transporter substrate-binding protein [Pelagicoccus albus]|nr:ABC transporter substrate-binding protein [Pelagicoccus albus]